ncbi:glycosyltransferase [Dasania marina]|uniref:glycosyltransferase n=1 Tax=Dasania marina TaxID=471499 RepID=UPI000360E00B|nr:glycosyltransferase [Dasania marina]
MEVSTLSSTNAAMRILHVASGDLWAGAEVQLFTLVSALAAIEGNALFVVLLNEGELARRLRDIAVPVLVIDESHYGPKQILGRLKAHMLSVKPHVVHTHRLKENIIGALANTYSAKAYCVRTVHGAPEFSYSLIRQTPKWLISRLDKWVGRHLQHKVIAVSQPLSGLLQNIYPASHIAVVLNGVDVDTLSSIKAAELGREGVKHVGIVGRLVPVKRVDLFLQMAKALVDQANDNYCFHIIGDGPLLDDLQRQAAKLGLKDVTFYGHREDATALIKAMDVLVMCSDHEGLPMTALESVAIGTPMVAHAVGGLVPLFETLDVCELVAQHNAEGYAGAVARVLARMASEPIALRLPGEYTAQGNAMAMMAVYRAGALV